MSTPGEQLSFGTGLLTRTGSEALLRLNDEELRQLEVMRTYFAKRAKVDQEYAQTLTKLRDRAPLARQDSVPPTEEPNPIMKVWQMFMAEMDRVSALLSQHSQALNGTCVQALDKLLTNKKNSKKRFATCRQSVDGAYGRTTERVTKLKKVYRGYAREAEAAKHRYLSAIKSTKAKDVDRFKERYIRAAQKLYSCHNDYVLALQAVEEHQESYRVRQLPLLLNNMQQICQGLAQQWMDALSEGLEHINVCRAEYHESFDRLVAAAEQLDPEQEYVGFLERNRDQLPAAERFTFDTKLLDGSTVGLQANCLIVNNLTHQALEKRQETMQRQLESLRKSLQAKSDELEVVRNASVDESAPAAEQMEQHMGTLRKYSDLSLDVEQTWLEQSKVDRALQLTAETLATLSNQPPPYFDDNIGDISNQDIISQDGDAMATHLSTQSAVSKRLSVNILGGVKSVKKIKKKISNAAKRAKTSLASGGSTSSAHSPTNADSDDEFDAGSEYPEEDYDDPYQPTVEEETWYHGELSRGDAECLLKNNGDFLVRYSAAKDHYTLTVRSDGMPKHFIVQYNEEGYRFEGDAFPSIPELIEFQLSSRAPVTRKSNAILLNAIRRPNFQSYEIKHDNVIVGERIGKGNFGDVHEGTLRPSNTKVAVKTCRSEDFPDKRKFLAEAEILQQYDHPNIVKLIGICADKEPIYIVMELMSGGNFLVFLRTGEGKKLKAPQLTDMCRHAAAGMEYLESHHCIHRDLAARNCLVGEKNVLKISDFGMSREEEDGIYTVSQGMKQIPIKWTAPEALNYGRYTTASDVWSYGILLWETYTYGSSPYPGMSNREARDRLERGYRMSKPELCPQAVYDVMLQCWEHEPDDRPSFREVHSLIKKLCSRG